ncbi:hypothetical protein LZ31DRAFT_63582 [Colletotrichum somersetense]|nr:hypothetical protein LZ31DRAFT_63582 [Colletotrichum somersetense]
MLRHLTSPKYAKLCNKLPAAFVDSVPYQITSHITHSLSNQVWKPPFSPRLDFFGFVRVPSEPLYRIPFPFPSTLRIVPINADKPASLACLLPRKEKGTPPPSSPLQIIHQRRLPLGWDCASHSPVGPWLLDCIASRKKELLMSPLSSNYRLTRFIFTNQRDRCRAASHKLANSSLRTTNLSTHGSLPNMMMVLLFENTGKTPTECLLGLLDSPSRRGTRLVGWAGMANRMQQGTYLPTCPHGVCYCPNLHRPPPPL